MSSITYSLFNLIRVSTTIYTILVGLGVCRIFLASVRHPVSPESSAERRIYKITYNQWWGLHYLKTMSDPTSLLYHEATERHGVPGGSAQDFKTHLKARTKAGSTSGCPGPSCDAVPRWLYT